MIVIKYFLILFLTVYSVPNLLCQNHYEYEPSSVFPFGQINPDAPEQLKDFDPLIGECDCKSIKRTNNIWNDRVSMVWRFKYIMNGMAIQDEVISENGKHGGSIRQFNTDSLRWYVHYYSADFLYNQLPVWEGNRINDSTIVLMKDQISPNGAEGDYRIVFSGISLNGFNWIGEWVSKDKSIVYPIWKIFCKKKMLSGYKINSIFRASNTYIKDNSNSEYGKKSIPVSLWYPNTYSGNEYSSLRQQDYVGNISLEKTHEENIATYGRILNSFATIDSTITIDSFLEAKTNVYSDVPIPSHKRPLVVICGAHPIYNTELAEKLANKGFVVASFPRLGKHKGDRLGFNQEGSAEFKEDLKSVVGYLSKLPFVDSTQLAFITWSFEGLPCFEYAKTDNNVKLFLSFDSSLGYDYGKGLSNKEEKTIIQKIGFPLIHYTSSQNDHGKDLSLLNSLTTSGNRVQINRDFELSHGEFTSIQSISISKLKSESSNPEYLNLINTITYKLNELMPVE